MNPKWLSNSVLANRLGPDGQRARSTRWTLVNVLLRSISLGAKLNEQMSPVGGGAQTATDRRCRQPAGWPHAKWQYGSLHFNFGNAQTARPICGHLAASTRVDLRLALVFVRADKGEALSGRAQQVPRVCDANEGAIVEEPAL